MIHPVFWGHDLRVTNLFFFGGRKAQSRDANETCECAGKKSDEHFVTMEFGRKIWVVGLTLTKTVVFFPISLQQAVGFLAKN